MKTVVTWFKQKNRQKRLVFIFLFLTIIFYAIMGAQIFGMIGDFNRGYMLDLKFFYSGDVFTDTLNAMSSEQIQLYQNIHFFDYLFLLTFYPFLVFLNVSIYKKRSLIILLPFVAMIFDFIENLLIDLHMSIGLSHGFGVLAGISTMLKFTIILISIALMIYTYMNNLKQERSLKEGGIK